MSDIDTDEALTLSAQHLFAAVVSIDAHTTALVLTDGEEAVQISHEIGNLETAAFRLAAVGRALIAHSEGLLRARRRH